MALFACSTKKKSPGQNPRVGTPCLHNTEFVASVGLKRPITAAASHFSRDILRLKQVFSSSPAQTTATSPLHPGTSGGAYEAPQHVSEMIDQDGKTSTQWCHCHGSACLLKPVTSGRYRSVCTARRQALSLAVALLVRHHALSWSAVAGCVETDQGLPTCWLPCCHACHRSAEINASGSRPSINLGPGTGPRHMRVLEHTRPHRSTRLGELQPRNH